MPDEQKTKLRLEIAHVLFIDIVGYSKLRTTEQSAHMDKLRMIARGTDQFRTAEAEGKLLRLPTGDGGALVFRNLEAPVLCAVEIANALKNHPEIRVRMGIHSDSQRSGQRGDRSQRAGEHCRSRNQPCSTRDGLWRCRPHPGFEARRRRSRTIRSVAAVSPRSRRVRNQTRRATARGQFLQSRNRQFRDAEQTVEV